jgi:hypothetical protein
MGNDDTGFDFGETISSYSRAQAIEDGMLIDQPLTRLAKEAGIKYHCAMTCALYGEINPSDEETSFGQDLDGRLWDMLQVFLMEIRRGPSRDRMDFFFLVQRKPAAKPEKLHLRAICGPGDDPTPVLTFMLPNED